MGDPLKCARCGLWCEDEVTLDRHACGPSARERPKVPREGIRHLFRNTVTVADEDPPGMEFRLLIQRPFQSEGSVFFTTSSKPLAAMELRRERARYVKWEPNTRLWMEQRQVSDWREVEE